MAWTAPHSWVVNEVIQSATLNETRDDLNWLANDLPRVSAQRSTNQSIANSSNTDVFLTGTDEFDVGSMHNPGVNSNLITIPSGGDGLYDVRGSVSWDSNGSGRRNLAIAHNGANIGGAGSSIAPDPSGSTVQGFSVFVQCVAGDTLSMNVLQTSGGPLNINASRFQAVWRAF